MSGAPAGPVTPPSPVVARVVFEGPNRYLPTAAVFASLDRSRLAAWCGADGNLPAHAAGRLADVLLEQVRATRMSQLSKAMADLIAGREPPRATRMLAMLTVELLRLVGERCDTCRELASEQDGGAKLAMVYGIETRGIGLAAIEAASELIGRAATWDERDWSVAAAVAGGATETFLALAASQVLNISMRSVAKAAETRHIPWLRPDAGRQFVQLGLGCHQRGILNIISDETTQIGMTLATSKSITALMLSRLGLPIARHERVQSADEAIAAAGRIGYPVVVKPDRGGQAQGISVGVRAPEQVAAAFAKARAFDTSVLIEELVSGSDHRMVVVGGRLVSTVQRRPAHVVGDGTSSVARLIEIANSDPRRGHKVSSALMFITIDDEVTRILAEQGLSTKSVPAAGRTVELRRTANLTTGGTVIDVGARVHPDNQRMAELTARASGLDIVGIDFLTTDIAVPFHALRCAINEINTRPGLHPYLVPGEPNADVTGAIIDHLFPAGTPPALPVALLCGGTSVPVLAAKLGLLLGRCGLTPALATSAGLVVDGVTLSRQPMSGDRAAAHALLRNPRTQAAILGVAPEAVLRRGVGLETWSVLVLPDGEAGPAAVALAAAVPCPIVAPVEAAAALAAIAPERLILVERGDDDGASMAAAVLAALAPAARDLGAT